MVETITNETKKVNDALQCKLVIFASLKLFKNNDKKSSITKSRSKESNLKA